MRKYGCFSSGLQMPRTLGVLGYGAIGKGFIDIVLQNYPKTNIVAVDVYKHNDSRFKYIKHEVNK